MKNILITGIGGPTPRSIAKSVRRLSADYKIIGVDANPRAIGFFMPGLLDKYFVIPRMTEDGYWDRIKEIIDVEKIDLAFVQPESEVIGWGHYLRDKGVLPCPVLLPPVELATVLIDKSSMSEVLSGTLFIPKTLKINQNDRKLNKIEEYIKFPCWIRAVRGSGGLGSLKVVSLDSLNTWLDINKDIEDYTVSEFLSGRHLATEMLYYEGEYLKGASLECVEYVMASIAPSKVTGNTSFGRLINEDKILKFCNECVEYMCKKINIKANGVLSFDLKEDTDGNLKVTEVNIRHMAYTGVMAQAGFDLIHDTVIILLEGGAQTISREPFFKYSKPYIFLRDVDVEPILLDYE